jgi:hypothetical protein
LDLVFFIEEVFALALLLGVFLRIQLVDTGSER